MKRYYTICGFPIEVVDARPTPYRLVAVFTHGRELIVASGHSPSIVRAAEDRIARNPLVIARIELRDGSGVLETIWANTWEALGGITP